MDDSWRVAYGQVKMELEEYKGTIVPALMDRIKELEEKNRKLEAMNERQGMVLGKMHDEVCFLRRFVHDQGLDMLIVGHTHKPTVSQPHKLVFDCQNNRVSQKPFKVVTSASWLEYGGYAAQKMLLPSGYAKQWITLCGDHKEILVTM